MSSRASKRRKERKNESRDQRGFDRGRGNPITAFVICSMSSSVSQSENVPSVWGLFLLSFISMQPEINKASADEAPYRSSDSAVMMYVEPATWS